MENLLINYIFKKSKNEKSYYFSVCAAIAVTTGWNYCQSNNLASLSDLSIANVEALAEGEVTTPTDCPGGTVLCAWLTTPEGPVTYYKK